MSRPKGKKEYHLLSVTSDIFNRELELMVNRGWKPSPVPIVVFTTGDEFKRGIWFSQMMERIYYIEKEERL